MKTVCSQLLSSDGTIISDTNGLLECWADHFHHLGQSQSTSNESLQEFEKRVKDHSSSSYSEDNNVLGTEFDVEEIQHAIQRLRWGRAGGPDGVSPEHLKHSGPVFQNWLCQIYNHICRLEQIPQCFKHGIVIPAFKKKGRDPLHMKSYRGVTLTSVIAKVLEIALIQRISPILDDKDIPQLTQTAYRRGTSCQDSIFAGMKGIANFVNDKENVYTCFYDIASDFDTVEFSVLLEELFLAGIRGKCWRLIRNWYSNLVSQVKLSAYISRPFNVLCGICQGFFLSPTLFNLVLDPLLSALRQRNIGLSINGLYLGAFAHVDNIRTCATNIEDVCKQVSIVNTLGFKVLSRKVCSPYIWQHSAWYPRCLSCR